MASILKVDTIQDQSGNNIINESGDTITIGASGDTVTIPSGATISNLGTATGFGGANTPAFEAYLGTDQTLSDATETKIQVDTESFDTDNAYDNATNYRFTVPADKAGKYHVYASVRADAATEKFNSMYVAIKKNGSYYPGSTVPRLAMGNNQADVLSIIIVETIDLSASDYLELYAWCDVVGGSANPIVQADATWFGAYKIIE